MTKQTTPPVQAPTAKAVFKKPLAIRFSDCDPAGILFFGNIYQQAHDFYEDFAMSLGYNWKQWFENGEWVVPLRHTSAEHLIPIRPGEAYEMTAEVERIGDSSFTGKYKMLSAMGVHAEVTLVHTFASATTFKKISIPADVRRRLETYQSQCLNS